MMYRKYPTEVVEYVRSLAGKEHKPGIAKLVNNKFGLNLTKDNIRSIFRYHHIKSEFDGRFTKGKVPWNKGKVMRPETKEKLLKTLFHKGNVPWTHREVGSIRTNKEGHVIIKVAETGRKTTDWRPLKNIVWELRYGKVPAGKIITMLDGNKYNFNLSNLACITCRENAMINKLGMRYNNSELTRTSINIVKVNLKISDYNKRNGDGKSKENKEVITKKCLFCGEEFKTTNRLRLYCSSNCRIKEWKSKKK